MERSSAVNDLERLLLVKRERMRPPYVNGPGLTQRGMGCKSSPKPA
jgi:hypothetical protein